jgi:hypothetical protein
MAPALLAAAPASKNLRLTASREYRKRSRGTLWQKKFHDHILRPRGNAAVAGYVWMNPVREGEAPAKEAVDAEKQPPTKRNAGCDYRLNFARGLERRSHPRRLREDGAPANAKRKNNPDGYCFAATSWKMRPVSRSLFTRVMVLPSAATVIREM